MAAKSDRYVKYEHITRSQKGVCFFIHCLFPQCVSVVVGDVVLGVVEVAVVLVVAVAEIGRRILN